LLKYYLRDLATKHFGKFKIFFKLRKKSSSSFALLLFNFLIMNFNNFTMATANNSYYNYPETTLSNNSNNHQHYQHENRNGHNLWSGAITGRSGMGLGRPSGWGPASGLTPMFRSPIATEAQCCVC
jgi:hypothetical protein